MNIEEMYEGVEDAQPGRTGFRITQGEFKDISFVFNRVKFEPTNNEDGTKTCLFDYDLIEGEVARDNRDFMNLIGDILIHELDISLNEGGLVEGEMRDGRKNGNDNIKEPHL
jgi:hypothetical protein